MDHWGRPQFRSLAPFPVCTLQPHNGHDVTSCLTPLLLHFPCFDGLSPFLNYKLNSPTPKLLLSGIWPEQQEKNKYRCQRHTGERQPFQQMAPGKPDTHMHKKGESRVSPCTNINSKGIADFKIGKFVIPRQSYRIWYRQELPEKDNIGPENNSKNWQMGLYQKPTVTIMWKPLYTVGRRVS